MSEHVGTIGDPGKHGPSSIDEGNPSGPNKPFPSEVPDDDESEEVCVIEAPTKPDEVTRP